MSYCYQELADCEKDLRILEEIQARCAQAAEMAEELRAGLGQLASSTSQAIMLESDELFSALDWIGGSLCDAVDEIRQVAASAAADRAEEAAWCRQQNALEDERQREYSKRQDGGSSFRW